MRTAHALALLAALAAAPAGAQTLRFGVGAQVTSADPHYHNIGPNNAYSGMVYDRLIEMSPKGRPEPMLARSWTSVKPDVWELKLQPGVRFHDGAAFTAEDVAFTFKRIPLVVNSPGSFSTYLQGITSAEVVDALTLRIHTDGPSPLLPVNLTQVPIIGRGGEGKGSEAYNAGSAANGTGPFRQTDYIFGNRADLTRNDAYWGAKPHWARVDYRFITNPTGRTAAMLAGDVDIIDQVPTSDMARLKGDARVRLSEIDSLRLMYIALDRSRTGPTPFITDNDGKPLDKNPLNDIRVRQALDLAIDRTAIVARVMEGVAAGTRQMMPEGAYGWVPDLPVGKGDPALARRLLAEAGFPNGFAITLHGPNDRYPNDARLAQAVGQMWTRIGVKTAVEVSPYASFATRASKQDFSAFVVSWGSSTGEPSAGLRSVLATYNRETGMGSVNRFRYSNPAFDRGLAAAVMELDDAKRERMLQDVTRLAMNDIAMIPTHLQRNVWAMRPGLVHEARVDERSMAQDVRPAP